MNLSMTNKAIKSKAKGAKRVRVAIFALIGEAGF